MRIKHFIATAIVSISTSLLAQSYVIENGMVYTLGAKGTLAKASVWIENGKIKAVGETVSAPASAKKIDAKGKIVTPGFFDPYSQVGTMEIPSVSSANDSGTSSKEITAAFRAVDAYNAYSTVIPITRVEGITRILCVPRVTDRLFYGTGAVVELGSLENYVVLANATIHFVFGEKGAEVSEGSRASALSHLRSILQDALDYKAHKNDYDQARRRKYAVSQADLQALVPAVEGKTPIIVHVNQASDIDKLIQFKKEFPGIRWIFYGAAQGWMRAQAIAQAKIPVIVEGVMNIPYTFEKLGSTMENAAKLNKAGVTIAFTYSDDPFSASAHEPHNSRSLRYMLGNIVAAGLPWMEGLKSVTVNPAKMYGVPGYGTLEPGKDADVVVWSGDPFEISTVAENVFIRGKEISMVTRQTLLRDRYKNLSPKMPHAYPSQ